MELHQNVYAGTAAPPPVEFVLAQGINDLKEHITKLEARIATLEAKLGTMELRP